MKTWTQLFILIITISTYAQDFKPYKVKSGKIIYEKLKYSTHSGFSSINGVETSFSEQVPYVAEQVIYYWDNFGDVAFEETYKISAFGGKLLPQKIKISERFWVDEHRYYFNIEENKISDDPYYLRIKCRENFQYYQIIGSWIKTQYMGVEEQGTKEILGKEADYYRIDNYQDIYAWKGLVLKDEDFATRGLNGSRSTIERAKVAVEMDTVSKVNDTIFNPNWLKREKRYQSLDYNKINELLDTRLDLLEQADNIEGIDIKKNDILLYVTTNHRLGKMQVLAISEEVIIIKFEWYYNDNSLGSYRESFKIKKNTLVDIDEVTTNEEKTSEVDFKWESMEKTVLLPVNNIGIYLLKSSTYIETQK